MALQKVATIVFLVGLLTAQTLAIPPPPAVVPPAVHATDILPSSSSMYPYYSAFGNAYLPELTNDYDVNVELARYAYDYNIPATNLYSMYQLIHDTMPTLSTRADLDMIRNLASALQNEYLGYVDNYSHPLISQLNTSNLAQYLPDNYPRSYLNMMGYLDSQIPRLSDSTYDAIRSAIQSNVPPSLANDVDHLTFAMGNAMRYMAYNNMGWNAAY